MEDWPWMGLLIEILPCWARGCGDSLWSNSLWRSNNHVFDNFIGNWSFVWDSFCIYSLVGLKDIVPSLPTTLNLCVVI